MPIVMALANLPAQLHELLCGIAMRIDDDCPSMKLCRASEQSMDIFHNDNLPVAAIQATKMDANHPAGSAFAVALNASYWTKIAAKVDECTVR